MDEIHFAPAEMDQPPQILVLHATYQLVQDFVHPQ